MVLVTKTEVKYSSEKSAEDQRTTLRYIPKYITFQHNVPLLEGTLPTDMNTDEPLHLHSTSEARQISWLS
jgi:hypothetical protein